MTATQAATTVPAANVETVPPVTTETVTPPVVPPEGTPPATVPPTETVTPPAETVPPVKPAEPDPVKPDDKPTEYSLKLPEGAKIDSSVLDGTISFAKENKLSNEQAQAVLDKQNAAVLNYADLQQQAFESKKQEWRDAAVADKEIGGEGFTKNVELAHRALDRFGSAELKAQFDKTGFGNHPEIIRAFSKIGAAMQEDKIPPAGAPVTTQGLADKLYDNPSSKT